MSLILPFGLQRKQVHDISAEKMAWLATAEDILPDLQMTIMCLRCRTPIHGENDEADATISVHCACRTLVYRVRAESPS